MGKIEEYKDDESGKVIGLEPGTVKCELKYVTFTFLPKGLWQTVDNVVTSRFFENKASYDKWIKKLAPKD